MKIELEVRKINDWNNVDIKIRNGLCLFQGYDLLNDDALIELYQELKDAARLIRDYRLKKEVKDDNE